VTSDRARFEQTVRFCHSPDGVRIAYATSGSGPPIIKTANWLSHLHFDLESPVWRHWLTELSRGRTLIRYDMRGCGLSDWEVDDLSDAADLADLEAVVAASGVDRFALLALSGGVASAIAYAVKYPERVSHLVLCGCYLQGRIAREPGPEGERRGEMMLDMIRYGWGEESSAFRQVYTSLFLPEGSEEQLAWWNELQRISTTPELAARRFAAKFRIDLREVAARVTVPTLVLHARGEKVVPFDQGRQLAALIPNARFVPLDSCNHVLLEEEPAWEVFLREFREFLGIDERRAGDDDPAAATAELTPRQLEVLALVADGLSDREIGERLSISEYTVHRHVSDILGRIGAPTRTAAVARALRSGLL
jgi:pimeloyl-ACP methyl ester carboxylesterase/DNA-binding CsgD family transcriptional regulator